MAVREDVLASAVAFLRNPKVQESPLARRVAFLESKGLTAEEVQEALARAGGTGAAATTAGGSGAASNAAVVNGSAATGPAAVMAAYPPGTVIVPAGLHGTTGTLAERAAATTWKDAFIGVVLLGGASYAAVKAFQHWVLPSLHWPTAEAVEAEKRELEAKLRETGEQLATIREQTTSVLTALEAQSRELQTTLRTMQTTLTDLTQADTARDDDLRRLKEELEGLKSAMPRALDKAKEDQKYALNDLQAELKSLKGLMLNRRPTATGVPAAPLPTSAGVPASPLPSAAAAASSSLSSTSASAPTPSAAGSVAPLYAAGAGSSAAPTTTATAAAAVPAPAPSTPAAMFSPAPAAVFSPAPAYAQGGASAGPPVARGPLFAGRASADAAATTAPPAPSVTPSRAYIPAWQLAAAPPAATTEAPAAAAADPAASASTSAPVPAPASAPAPAPEDEQGQVD